VKAGDRQWDRERNSFSDLKESSCLDKSAGHNHSDYTPQLQRTIITCTDSITDIFLMAARVSI
jgi:hypothetical protein